MREWIRTSDLNQYDVISAFEELIEINWRKSKYNIGVGDTVFIYVGSPYSKIMYKTVCVKDGISARDIIDDRKFWGETNFKNLDTEYVRLHLITKMEDEQLTLEYLQKHSFIKHGIQGAYKSEGYPELFAHINSVFDGEKAELQTIVVDAENVEGKKIAYYTTKYERNVSNRNAAVRLHGCKCMICGFDFEQRYGSIGKNFIEVHHIKPLYDLKEEVAINPKNDLICVCSNCHRMLHRKRGSVLTPEELKMQMNDL